MFFEGIISTKQACKPFVRLKVYVTAYISNRHTLFIMQAIFTYHRASVRSKEEELKPFSPSSSLVSGFGAVTASAQKPAKQHMQMKRFTCPPFIYKVALQVSA